jgi:hypothetical protein
MGIVINLQSGALDIANWGVDQSRQTQRAELSLRFRKLLAVMRLRSRGSVSKSECGAIINNGSIIQKNEQCDGGTRTALNQRGGKLSGSRDDARGRRVPGAAGLGDPLADHARTGGVVVTAADNVAAAKSKLSVETPNWAPGQPLRGALLPIHSGAIRRLQTMRRQWQAARRLKHWQSTCIHRVIGR